MSAFGQKATCAPQNVMSALPPKATLDADFRDVCFGPLADIREVYANAVTAASAISLPHS
jgi:hypothetical protein